MDGSPRVHTHTEGPGLGRLQRRSFCGGCDAPRDRGTAAAWLSTAQHGTDWPGFTPESAPLVAGDAPRQQQQQTTKATFVVPAATVKPPWKARNPPGLDGGGGVLA
jgi:hypothetical protein